MQPLSGNQRPDLLTSLMNISFVLCLPQKMHLCRSSSNAPRLPWFLEMRQNPHVLLTFDKVHNPLHLPRETTSQPPKVARTCGVLYILNFEMCFAPQRRALSLCLSVCLSIQLSICKLENEAILRDFLIFRR